MKRVITYLIVLLVTLPAMGQQINEGNQKFERFIKHNVIDAFKEHRKNNKNSLYDVISKQKSFHKFTRAVDKKELDSLISERWDDNVNKWVNDSKEEFTYDSNENVNSFIIYSWNEINSQWDRSAKFEFSFDTNRKLMAVLTYYWQSWNSQWGLTGKIEFNYDTNGNLTLETAFAWDFINNQYVQSYKTEYTYDGNQNIILSTGFEWLQNQWLNSYKDEFIYNTSNKLILEYNYYWNYGTSQWDAAYAKWDYDYDVNNNLISEILSDWDGSQWVNNDKYEYTYNAGGNITEDIGSDWSLTTSQWVFVYKDEYTYDTNANRTFGYYYQWDAGTSQWSVYYKDEFIFDLAYGINDIIGPILFEDFLGIGYGDMVVAFNNMVIGYRGYEYVSQAWVDSDKSVFYYSNYSNPLNLYDEILSASVILYPNPVEDVLTVNSKIPLTKVEIYSLLGKKVTEVKVNFNAIQMKNLSKGIYIIRIHSDNGSTSRKLIKK